MGPAGVPSTGSLLRGAWKLYVPVAAVAGTVVAAPTLLSSSTGGRAVGVVPGVAIVALGFVAVVRSGRSAGERGVQPQTSTVSGTVTLTQATQGPPGSTDAMIRRMRRLQMLARIWLPLSATGLLAGAWPARPSALSP
jgi:hypothetical protein